MTVFVGKGKPGGGRKRCYIINPAGVGWRCDCPTHCLSHTTSLLPKLWDEAFAHGHGTVHGHGTAHGHGQSMGVMALGARASVGQGTYDLVQVMCRPVHAGPTYLGLPPEACDYWTTGQERPLRASIDTAPRLRRC